MLILIKVHKILKIDIIMNMWEKQDFKNRPKITRIDLVRYVKKQLICNVKICNWHINVKRNWNIILN